MSKNNKKTRFDLEIIANLIEERSKVLDIGCGNGQLLEILKNTKKVDVRGLEISSKCVSKAVAKGISVIQGDANSDLKNYPDNSFDYAILSQTLQAMSNPQKTIEEMVRIAQYAIISLPNFAYFKNRFYLLLKGKMPVRKTIPYQWYDTPNIHFCSINDFENLCKEMDLYIKEKFYLGEARNKVGALGYLMPNFFAEYGIFMITKNELAPVYETELTIKAKEAINKLKASEPKLANQI